ncbi:MAG: folylpolyglutamate synthase/dihydrofolate synthase family protein [Desulfobacteraceae bacterium]|jgi:dihydrofolate synthase/folylpolyglutamate synthase
MGTQDTYTDCLQEMFGLRRFGIKLGLDTIRRLLQGMQNPQESFTAIHVAGTNGKGSIASALAAILKAAGLRAGLYTSPHLVRFNERICIDGEQISDEEVVASHQAVKAATPGEREPTFFEYATAMAFDAFRRRGVAWAVIETGMGGRLDATNIIAPALSIISNVSIEHEMYLGRTLAQIAAEKGGIIKPATPVVTGVRQPPAVRVLETIAGQRGAPIFRLGKDFRVRRGPDGTFSYFGIANVWHKMRTGLPGSYQVDNAGIVLAACELLNQSQAVEISLGAIRQGFEQRVWPGRLEVVATDPMVILDGAHNRIAAKNLAAYLRHTLSGRKITLVVGILNDKPYRAMLKSLLPVCDRVVLTRPQIERALSPESLRDAARDLITDITLKPDVASALQYALETAAADEVICVGGSLYMVGDAKVALAQMGLGR